MIVRSHSFLLSLSLAAGVDRAFSQWILNSTQKKKKKKNRVSQLIFVLLRANKTTSQKPVSSL